MVRHLLAGTDVVMTASALLRHGPEYAGTLLEGLSAWMAAKGLDSVAEVRGRLARHRAPTRASNSARATSPPVRAANAVLARPLVNGRRALKPRSQR